MTDLNEMWQELERYQPFAEKHGFGEAWKRMTTERTEDAARVVWDAAYSAACYAAARAAAEAAEAAWDAADGAQQAIQHISKAIEQEQT